MIPQELKFSCLCIGGAILLVLVIWVLSMIDDADKNEKRPPY